MRVRFWWWCGGKVGGQSLPTFDRRRVNGSHASSLAPASSSPSLSPAPLFPTFLFFEKNSCEKAAANLPGLATSFRFLPPMKSHASPAWAQFSMIWVSWGVGVLRVLQLLKLDGWLLGPEL